MRSVGLGLICCLFFQLSFTQNYADSAFHLYSLIETDSLPPKEKKALEDNKTVFTQATHDSLILKAIFTISSTIETPEVSTLFNDLGGRICKKKLEEPLSAADRNFYQRQLLVFYRNQSFFFAHANQIEKALEANYKSLALSEKIKDSATLISSITRIGVLCFNNGDYDKAEEWIRRAYQMQVQLGDTEGSGRNSYILSAIMIKQGNAQAALPYLHKNLQTVRKEKKTIREAELLEAIGQAYRKIPDLDSALFYLEAAYAKYREENVRTQYSGILAALGNIYSLKGDWKNAEKYGIACLEEARQFKFPAFEKNAAGLLQQVYEAKGDYRKSLEMIKRFYALQDSLQSESNTQAILEQQYAYEYRRKAEVDSLKNAQAMAVQLAENKSRKQTAYFLGGGLVLTLLFGFILFNRFRLTKQQKEIIELEKSKLDQANEQLKELDQAKSRFFTNISHEFRTPLTVISGMTDMITENEESKELIKRNSENLLLLINQILDLRKLESGSLPLYMRQENIIPYLKYLLESFQSYAESKSINLQFKSDSQLVMMDFDAEKIRSIMTNLIANAIRFSPEGGEVSVEVSSSPKTQNPKPKTQNPKPETQNKLTIRVSDTGIGIAPEKIPHVFDRFYQVDDSMTRKGEGTGIGLTLTHELIKLMGGEIELRSEVGRGSSFEISLPISNIAPFRDEIIESKFVNPLTEASLIPAGSISSKETEALKLLIVEDNLDVVHYLKLCLGETYQISIAHDGQEGIEKAIEEVPDIIISDVMMPRKDGFELCESLKQDERTSHIPIILLTAKADVESRISGLKRGADAYLAKPFNKEELLVRVDMLIRLRQQLQQRYAQQITALSPTEDIEVQQEDAFILKFRDVIMAHFDDPELNVPKLCDMLGISRTQLHRKVTALTGKSATRFLRKVRMEEAQKLLKNPELNISDIAYRVGYNDPSYFGRLFVEDFGIPPTMARE